jgi:serine/threonine-protein kinase
VIVAAASERDRIGPYQLIKAIGAGGSARIDLAKIERAFGFARHVVIKRPLEHLRDDPRAAASLRREARLGAMLRHPNLVAVLDAGTHDNYDYLALEYIHGGSLRTLMQADVPAKVAPVPREVAVAIAIEVARGLDAAHELVDETGAPLGLVHRDVSPGNILVGLDGAVKLADFGIAKETRIQTLSGSMHGTVTYMAPEQCRGHAFDRRADVFSLGVILYELLTGTRLFLADNDVASLHRVLSGDVPRPRKLVPTIPAELEDIVLEAVAHDQDKRIPTARSLVDALETYAASSGEILGARWVARWVHELIGPREAPWIGAATIPDVAAALQEERPLVELIDAVPADPVPPHLTFGPTSITPEDLDTQPRREPPRKTRMLAVVGVGAAAGVAATILWMTRTPDSVKAPPISEPPVVKEEIKPPPVKPPEPPVVVEEAIEMPPVIKKKPARRAIDKRPAEPPVEPVVVAEPPIEVKEEPPKPPPKAGSGSQGKAVWAPDIFLPTDKKKKP